MSFTHPSPLLAAAILHVAAAHYPSPELAAYQPVYLQAGYRAISALAIPTSFGAAPARPLGRTDKFDNVLGIVLIGLTTLGWIDGVGTWVSMAYRLLLDGLAEEDGRRVQDWRGLWEGLRVSVARAASVHSDPTRVCSARRSSSSTARCTSSHQCSLARRPTRSSQSPRSRPRATPVRCLRSRTSFCSCRISCPSLPAVGSRAFGRPLSLKTRGSCCRLSRGLRLLRMTWRLSTSGPRS